MACRCSCMVCCCSRMGVHSCRCLHTWTKDFCAGWCALIFPVLAKDKGACRENNVPNHCADDQPIPGVATVPADSWKEDRQCQHSKGGALKILTLLRRNSVWMLPGQVGTSQGPRKTSRGAAAIVFQSVHQSLPLSNILGHGHVNVLNTYSHHACCMCKWWATKALQWNLKTAECSGEWKYQAYRDAVQCRCGNSYKVSLLSLTFAFDQKHTSWLKPPWQGKIKMNCWNASSMWPKQTARWTCTLFAQGTALNFSLMPCMWNVFHSCIRSWKAPETEESKAAKAAERAEKAKKKKNKDKENKDKSDKEGVKSEEESDQPILGCSWVGTCCLGIWFCLPVK